MRGRALAALLLSSAMLLGCSATADPPDPIGTGKSADLDFTATTLGGQTFDGSRLSGKPTVLWFWAPWCPTCRAQSGSVADLARTYAGQVNVVGVGGLADVRDIREVASQIEGPIHLVDPDGLVWQHFRVTAQSTYTVIDDDGEIITEGYLDNAELADTVADLVG